MKSRCSPTNQTAHWLAALGTRSLMKRAAMALIIGLMPLPFAASAQQVAGAAIDSPEPAKTPPAARDKAPGEQAPLRAIAGPFKSLYQAGILVTSTFYDDFQGNMSGGLQRGTANAGAGTIGTDVDLAKVAGIRGGRFHLLFTYEYGDTLQNDIGNFIKSQDWYLPFQKFQLALMAYEQSLFDGKLDIYAGRVSAATIFARPTFGCNFVSGSQCPYYLPVFTGGFSGFPYATWGGRVRVNPTERTYVQAGVFAVDPGRTSQGGFDLSLRTTTGVNVPVEIGYESSFENDRYPRHYRLGAWWNNAPSNDPLLNTDGQSRALFGGSPLVHTRPRGGLYGLADQVIYRPDSSQRNVALFASFALPFDQREIFSAQNTIGVFVTGPFARRPADTAGLMVTQALFTRATTLFMNQQLQKNGSTSFVKRSQFIIEGHYGFRLTPGVTVTPNIAYIVNPDIMERLDARFAPKNALILGLRLTLSLDDALGIPSALPVLH